MKQKLTSVALIAFLCISKSHAGSTSSPSPVTNAVLEYATTVLGLAPGREDQLIENAQHNSDISRHAVLRIEAICNLWTGPFRLSEFARWLHDTHLGEGFSISDFQDMESGIGFPRLPPEMHAITIDLKSSDGLSKSPLFRLAVDENVTAKNFESILTQPPKEAEDKNSPIVYNMRPLIVPPGFDWNN